MIKQQTLGMFKENLQTLEMLKGNLQESGKEKYKLKGRGLMK